uniref:Secreted protein n=1 Tax=Mycena chlorophos TaxID=658473 RepID=A0ABQ0LLT1_MYCCL|nr:predicted protein [Mycena chlorophos]
MHVRLVVCLRSTYHLLILDLMREAGLDRCRCRRKLHALATWLVRVSSGYARLLWWYRVKKHGGCTIRIVVWASC